MWQTKTTTAQSSSRFVAKTSEISLKTSDLIKHQKWQHCCLCTLIQTRLVMCRGQNSWISAVVLNLCKRTGTLRSFPSLCRNHFA